MKIGCCLNLLANKDDPTGSSVADIVAEAGYDYVELPLALVTALSETEFDALLDRLEKAGIGCEACCNLFPGEVKTVGPQAEEARIRAYLDRAMDRARRLGAHVVVFGSVDSRRVPEGFPREIAILQYIQALRILNDYADDDLEIAIEHACRLEGNLIYTLREGILTCEICDRPHVRVLADTYHMSVEKEPPENLLLAGDRLIHVHTANPAGRVYPAEGDGVDYKGMINYLRQIDYKGRISIEAFSQNIQYDTAEALKVMRNAGA